MNHSDLTVFLRDLWLSGIELWPEADQLRFRGNKAAITPDRLDTLRENKAEILSLLQENPEHYLGFPQSEGQKAMYLQQGFMSNSAAYHLSALLGLNASFDREAFTRSLDRTLQRHPALCMQMKTLDGHFAQQPAWKTADILQTQKLKAEDNPLAWAKQAAEVPFDVENAPLIRAAILETPSNRYLLLIVHHIVTDFWGLNLFARDLQTAYMAERRGEASLLSETGKSLKDYILAERHYLESHHAMIDRDYWLSVLDPLPKTLLLNTDYPRSREPDFAGEEYRFNPGPELTRQIREAASRSNTSVFVWILSCYQILLHLYSRETRFSIGSPLAGRLDSDAQRMAASFTNPVCFVADFTLTEDFPSLVAHNREALRKALAHQRYPLQQVLESLDIPRESGINPLFQCAFSWNKMTDHAIDTSGLFQSVEHMQQHGAIHDLVLTGFDTEDSFDLNIRYPVKLFKRRTIAAFAKHLENILRQSTEGLKDFSELNILTPDERQRLYPDTPSSTPFGNVSVIDLFHDIADKKPSLIAFEDGEQQITYGELDSQANQLARFLQAEGVTVRQHIALLIPRSANSLIATLACLKLNAVYIPVDPEYPQERIALILEAGSANYCLDESTLKQKQVEISRLPTTRIQSHSAATANDCAMIIFTSGSTGTPKGVKTPHRALMRLGLDSGFIDIGEGDRMAYAGNVAFDVCNLEIWNALLNGGTLICISREELLDAQRLKKRLETRPLKGFFLTTGLFHALVASEADTFNHVSRVIIGGEAMDPGLARTFLNNNQAELYNLYGPAENGTVSTGQKVSVQSLDLAPASVGYAINRSKAVILNPYRQPCPVGVTGEITVAGDGVALGYLHQKGIEAPFFQREESGEIYYSTGDLGYLNDAGQIIYVGRADSQIKIRGFRIDPREIEAQLHLFEGIRQLVVICDTAQKEPRLWVYFSHEKTVDISVFQQFSRSRLPAYMQPQGFMQLPELPITANGKVDRKALPPITLEQTALRHPETPLQSGLLEHFKSVLAVDHLGIDNDFFLSGGHSLLATRLIHRIQQDLHYDITLQTLYTWPTVATLAEQLTQQSRSTGIAPIPKSDQDQPVPAHPMQQRLWFMQAMAPESFRYNMPVTLTFNRVLTLEKVEKALKLLLQRHDALRLAFHFQDETLWLQDAGTCGFALSFMDITTDTHESAQETIRQFRETPFQLEKGPQLKALLIRETAQRHILTLVTHHACIDGLSVAPLLIDLSLLLNDQSLPTEPPLAYLDFAQFSVQGNQPTNRQETIAFWQNYLKDTPPALDLPTDFPRQRQADAKGRSITFTLTETETVQLEDLAKSLNASLFTLLMASYAILLSRVSRQEQLAIGFPVSGREHPDTLDAVGLFINNLCLAHRLNGKTTFKDYIRQCQQNLLSVMNHAAVPFDELLQHLPVERNVPFIPFLQASMQFEAQAYDEQIPTWFGDDVSLTTAENIPAKYDLNLVCTRKHAGLQLSLEYAEALFENSTVQSLLESLKHVLLQSVSKVDQPINTLTLVQPGLATKTDIQPAKKNHLVVLFEKSVEQHKGRIAINDPQQKTDYQSLNQTVNRIAHALMDDGIGSGDLIGIRMEKSCALIISQLAVLKTGAAFVPLDPTAPAARLHFIQGDAQLSRIITDNDNEGMAISYPALLTAAEDQPCENPDTDIPPDDTAYVIYTSGTTGKPKGCAVSHHNVARLFTVTQPAFDFSNRDVWCLFHSPAFDFAVWEIFGALLFGGRLAIVPAQLARETDAFYRFVAEEKITLLNQTPSAFRAFSDMDKQKNLPLSLRQVIFGGEALDFSSLTDWATRHPLDTVRLTNMYGITEITIHGTMHTLHEDDLRQSHSLIGKPLDDLKILLLDSCGQQVPKGAKGEICIAGSGVAKGYLHRKELTAERFSNNPYATNDLEKTLYRSGDLGRERADGSLAYLGRIDRQVKIRGFRIEPDEIKSRLQACEGVLESFITVQKDQLVGYYLGDKAVATHLRKQLAHHLPDYMLPSAILHLEAWPLTLNGKIDEVSLPQPMPKKTVTHCAPRNETEHQLAEIWADLLVIDKATIGIRDNFFALGGHSLLATRMHTRILETFSLDLPLTEMFEAPTIEELGERLLAKTLDQQAVSESELLALLDSLEEDVPI